LVPLACSQYTKKKRDLTQNTPKRPDVTLPPQFEPFASALYGAQNKMARQFDTD